MKNYRKKLAIFLAAGAVAGLLAGCGGQETETKNQNGDNQTVKEMKASQGMKVVQTDKGEVEIPENPEVIFSDY